MPREGLLRSLVKVKIGAAYTRQCRLSSQHGHGIFTFFLHFKYENKSCEFESFQTLGQRSSHSISIRKTELRFTVYVAAYSFNQDFYFFKLTEEKLSPMKTKLYKTCVRALILIAS